MCAIKITPDRPAIRTQRYGLITPESKRADSFLASADYRLWRSLVVSRAGGRCEWIDGGQRCGKSLPQHRMFADHIEERTDSPGRSLDPANGMCLCGQHHTLKTARARARRVGGGMQILKTGHGMTARRSFADFF
jgi:5-methylcytosine-specific restriction protein A